MKRKEQIKKNLSGKKHALINAVFFILLILLLVILFYFLIKT